jgi:glycosyltransferase involved in cell wall biosynthesis
MAPGESGIPVGAVAAGDNFFGVGAPAEHPFGVLYQGPWETLHDGSCRAVRLHARALATTGLPVQLKSFNHTVMHDGVVLPVFEAGVEKVVQDEVLDLTRTSVSQYGVMIRHLVPRSAESLRQLLVPRSAVLDDIAAMSATRERLMRSNIIYSVWERDRIPEEIARVMSRAGCCWVPCAQNRVALITSGVPEERVTVVPHPFDPASRLAVEGPKRVPTGRKDFLSIGIWQPRKALHEAVGAFLRTFSPDEATLTVKTTPTSWPGYPTPQDSLRLWASDERVIAKGWSLSVMKGRVRMIVRRLSDDEITELHLASSIYLSPSHGEAWGLGAYDAKVAGNRLVHVPWGGTEDFCDRGDVAIPYTLGPVDPTYRWDEGTNWACYPQDALEEALRKVQPPTTHRRDPYFEACFGLEGVGRHMALDVIDVARDGSRKAAEYLESLRALGVKL